MRIKRNIILILASSLFYFVILDYYYLTQHFIYWRKPLMTFQPVIPNSLSKYPVYEDCRANPSIKQSIRDVKLDESFIKQVEYKASLIESLKLKKGYSVVRLRTPTHILHSPDEVFCDSSYFTLAIKNNLTRKLLYGNEQVEAFVITTDENLINLGKIIFGELQPFADQNYEKHKNENKYIYKNVFPENIKDNQITNNSDGSKTLHRFVYNGYPTGGVESYIMITVENDGVIKVDSQELFEYKSGILF